MTIGCWIFQECFLVTTNRHLCSAHKIITKSFPEIAPSPYLCVNGECKFIVNSRSFSTPPFQNSSTSNAPRSNAINRYTNEQSGYTSGGSPAMRRPPKTSLTSTGSTSTSDGTSVDGGGGNSTGTNRGKKTKEQDLVVQQTEQITKRIQDLLRTAKSQELTK